MTRYANETTVPSEKSRAEIEGLRLAQAAAFLSWAAGMFEGEGTVTITRSGRLGYTRALVMLTSTDRSIIDTIHGRWPGVIRSFTPKGNARQAHCWTLNSRRKIARFLFDVLPFLRTDRVREKAWLVLEDVGSRIQGPSSGDYLDRCHERRERIRELNTRGARAYESGSMPPLLPHFGSEP